MVIPKLEKIGFFIALLQISCPWILKNHHALSCTRVCVRTGINTVTAMILLTCKHTCT